MSDPTRITLPSEARLVGPALRALRVRLGFNQARLVAAGVGNQGVISALENARKMPLLPTVLAYLNAIGCVLEVHRSDGDPLPAETTRTRVVLNPRRGHRRPATRRVVRRPLAPRTSTGRCLECFRIHDGAC